MFVTGNGFIEVVDEAKGIAMGFSRFKMIGMSLEQLPEAVDGGVKFAFLVVGDCEV